MNPVAIATCLCDERKKSCCLSKKRLIALLLEVTEDDIGMRAKSRLQLLRDIIVRSISNTEALHATVLMEKIIQWT